MSLSDAEHLLCLALLVLLLVSVSRLSSMFLSSTIRPLASKTAFRLYLTISCLLAALPLGVCLSLLEIPLPEPSSPSGELTSPYRAQAAKPRPDYEHILRKPDKSAGHSSTAPRRFRDLKCRPTGFDRRLSYRATRD